MPHKTNQRAFRDCDSSEPFFRLYTILVATELALKDCLPAFEHTHDLSKLVARAVASIPSGLQAQLTTLDKTLGALVCTSKSSCAPVRANSFPDLRYLRHQKDGFADGCLDASIARALDDALQLVRELARAGISL